MRSVKKTVRGTVFPTNDVTFAQRGGQHLFDIGAEDAAIDRPVDHPRGGDRVMAQGGDEGHGVPVPEGSLSDQALAPCGPSPQRGHVGFGPGLVNENKSPDVDTPLMRLPPQALAGHVRPVLLTGERGFF